MKKFNVIIFLGLIFICCVTFILVLKPSFGATPIDYGSWWKSLSISEQYRYLQGWRDGESTIYKSVIMVLMNARRENELKNIDKDIILADDKIDLEVIQKVVSDIYKDPANTYIHTPAILMITINKLKGKSIDKELISKRRRLGFSKVIRWVT